MNKIRLSKIYDLTGNNSSRLYRDIDITSVTSDSRKAQKDGAFVCIKGALSDGHDYALSAYEKGCRVFLCEKVPRGFPKRGAKLIMCKNGTRAALADLCAEFYGHPERKIKLVGITGTKGKTTTAQFIYAMLEANGIKSGYIGTNGVDFGTEHYETVNTTPESCDIYKYLSMMQSSGVEVAVLEISSQALLLNRIRGLSFDVCVFTNLSPDHIGENEHPDFENYKQCKMRLFSDHCVGCGIMNIDSEYCAEFMSVLPEGVKKLTYSAKSRSADYFADSVALCRTSNGLGSEFELSVGGKNFDGKLNFPGEFNVLNALAALAVTKELGVETDKAISSLEKLYVAGRFECTSYGGVDYIIDYAHNGESLRSVLTVLRNYCDGRLICVYGSVGGRTKKRRAELGSVAAALADLSILTADNPDCEDPRDIISQIAEQYKDGEAYVSIPDRQEAIRYAVNEAKRGDIVLLAGKGHEKYQLVFGVREPFSEREILRELHNEMVPSK